MRKSQQQNGLLSHRLKRLSESATLAMAVKARELQAKGHDVIKLNLGEPDFPTPQHIQAAAVQAIKDGKSFAYSPVPGYPELRRGIADKLKRDNQLDYTPAHILVSTGAKQSIANIMLSLVNPGDEVIVFTPYWVTYIEQIRMAEGVPVLLKGNIENNFKITTRALRAVITPKTKALLFSSPCNPTGSVFSEEELIAIAAVVKQHENLLVISDEIYEHINFETKHFSIAQVPGMQGRTIIVNGFSKGFAMTGWRLGYMAAPSWIIKACNKLQGQVTSGACTISQRAGIAAINGSLAPTQNMAKAYLRRRNLVKKLLDQVPGFKTNMPAGAFYIFPDISSFFGKSIGDMVINSSYDFSMFLLNEAYVSVVAGEAFGAGACIRISFAAADQAIITAVERIKDAVAKLY